MNGQVDLADRIVRLDREPDNPSAIRNHHPDIVRFVGVMSRIVDSGIPKPIPAMAAAAADAMAAECALLERVEKFAPDIVTGPLSTAPQFWIGAGKPGHLPPGEPRLDQRHFQSVPATIPASVKPFHVGLFTSTGTGGGHGMWRTYLDLHAWSSLFPKPWWTWSVTVAPDIAVYEIDSATRWVDLVSTWPTERDGLQYPDWPAIAAHFDAVHITMRAIVAAQGLYFRTPAGPVAAPYWDVESTFWLRWRFTSTELVELSPS